MKPSFTPCFFSNRSLYWLAQRHHCAHVDLVEGREHGGGVLRVLQAARDGLAQPRHLHALFARGVVRRRRRAHLHGGGRLRNRRRLRGGALDRRHHVALGDAAVLAGARHGRRDRRRFRPPSCAPTAPPACRPRALARWLGAGFGRRGRRGFAGFGLPAPGLAGRRRAGAFLDLRRAARRPRRSRRPWPRCRRARRRPAPAPRWSPCRFRARPAARRPRPASPGFLNHLPMVASVTDSPRVGTRISAMIDPAFVSPAHPEVGDEPRRRGATSSDAVTAQAPRRGTP